MRIAIDPVPLVLGIYAYVGEVLAHAIEKREAESAEVLGKRLTRQRGQTGGNDREVQKMVRALHGDIKVADKLLKKTGDVWKISQETDLVDLVVGPRGEDSGPRAYVLLKPREIVPLLEAIRAAAAGAGESDETLQGLARGMAALDVRSNDYLAFGFNPWEG
ncbi:MAG: hypothetical protein L0271_26635 [Gemmatimonadetes bacterium]|nr:hypothetical protein [Gemmatimonadota bacterium]